MVISNLNIKLLTDRLGFINRAVVRMKKLSTLPEEDFLPDTGTASSTSTMKSRTGNYIL